MTTKTAISLQSPLLAQVDAMARSLKLSRSAFFARAAERYLEHLENEKARQALEAVYGGDGLEEEDRQVGERMIEILRRQEHGA